MDLSRKQKLNLLHLYSDRIITLIRDTNEDDFVDLRKFVPDEFFAKFIEKRSNQLDRNVGFKSDVEFLNELLNSSMNNALYNDILAFVGKKNRNLHRQLTVLDRECKRSNFFEVLKYSHVILPVLQDNLVELLYNLEGMSYKNLCDSVNEKRNFCDDITASKFLLRTLPKYGLDAFYDFFKSFGAISAGKDLRNLIYPHFCEHYDCYQTDKLWRQLFVVYVGQDDSLEDCLMIPDDHHINLDYQHLQLSAKSKEDLEYSDKFDDKSALTAFAPAKSLHLRSYQNELATNALQGKNTVICASTGSGKTIVAVKIIKEHLQSDTGSEHRRKVCFFVPTNVLVDQQKELIEQYLQDKWDIKGLKGGDSGILPKAPTIQIAHILSIPRNMLNYDDPADRLQLTDFSLLIFDEAHHANEKHPYNEIMRNYHELQHTKRIKNDAKLPQVVGLTASLGAGGKETQDVQDAMTHVLKMSANLCVQCISRVIVNSDELLAYSTSGQDEIKMVTNVHTSLPLYDKIVELMVQTEALLFPLLTKYLQSGDSKNAQLLPPTPRHQHCYENWFSNLLCNHVPRSVVEQDAKLEMTTYLENLKMYYKALDWNAHLPPSSAIKFMRDYHKVKINGYHIDQLLAGHLNVFSNQLTTLSRDRNGLFDVLLDCLFSEFDKQSNGRVIVFVRTRELAIALEDELNSEQKLVQRGVVASRLTSVNVSHDLGGQADAEQRSQLLAFRTGKVKILISTTVAEEGLDIEQCNLVIKYNYVTNEIALVQRRGRARAIGSRSVLLCQDKWIAEKEWANQKRERLMHKALVEIDKRGPTWFKQQKMDIQNERRRELALLDETKTRLDGNKYLLRCRKCDTKICKSVDVKLACKVHFVCVDTSVWSRTTVRPIDEVNFETMSVVGEVSCSMPDCGACWGPVIKYRQVRLPTLSIKCLVFENEKQPHDRITKKNWKQITKQCFRPGEISDLDMANMMMALKSETDILTDQIRFEIESTTIN